jgi:hypothetical protein
MTTLQLENMVENEPDFERLVRYFIVKAAISVAAEEVDHVNHTERIKTAGFIIRDPNTYVRRVMEMVITNATIASRSSVQEILDNPNDVEFMVNSIYDDVTLSDG